MATGPTSVAMEEGDPSLRIFEARSRQPGETVLAWVRAATNGATGVAVLTDRRLCFSSLQGAVHSVPVTGAVLRYNPRMAGDTLLASFETDAGMLEFAVAGDEEQRHLGNLLGNLAELREAQGKLEEAGIDPLFVSPPAEPGGEGVSAIYQLIRLKEMLNQGLFSEIEFALQRVTMIGRFRDQAAARP